MKKIYWILSILVLLIILFWASEESRKNYMLQEALKYKENGPETPLNYGQAFKKIEIEVADRTIVANYVEAANSIGSILIFHGRYESISQWAKVQAVLAEKNYSSMLIDYTGYSTSTNKVNANELSEITISAYERFLKLSKADEKRIVFGHSLGIYIILESAGHFSVAPDKIVLHAAGLGMRAMAIKQEAIPEFLSFILPYDFWNSELKMAELSSPYLIFNSDADDVIDLSISERLKLSVNKNGQLIILNNYRHNDIYLKPSSGIWDDILKEL